MKTTIYVTMKDNNILTLNCNLSTNTHSFYNEIERISHLVATDTFIDILIDASNYDINFHYHITLTEQFNISVFVKNNRFDIKYDKHFDYHSQIANFITRNVASTCFESII